MSKMLSITKYEYKMQIIWRLCWVSADWQLLLSLLNSISGGQIDHEV